MGDRKIWHGDQADGLRRLFGCQEPQIVAFASGHEACGRTTLVVQTAAALAAAGHGVVIVDENGGPNNILATFGISTRNDLLHVVRRTRSALQAALPAAPLVRVVAAAKAARDLDHEDVSSRDRLAAVLRELQQGASFVLIDCACRRPGHLSAAAALAGHVVVVVAAQGTAITNAYALIKRIAQAQGRDRFQIAVARARSPEEARAVYENMRRVASDHLGVRLDYLGASAVPVTDHLADALIRYLPSAPELAGAEGFVATDRFAASQPGMQISVL